LNVNHEKVPDWTIRSAAEQDIASVLSLWQAAGGLPTVTDTHEGLMRLLAADPQALLVAERDGAIVGSLIAAWDGWRGSFYRLAVHPDHRRLGIAAALLDEGERRLEQRGAVRLTAIAAADDPVATGFWHAVGYTRQHDRARFVRAAEGPAVRPTAHGVPNSRFPRRIAGVSPTIRAPDKKRRNGMKKGSRPLI
jgi:ribosomal protein S18 acetylase RimI-like enzyme